MITQAQLKELLHYDPDTGIFTWLQKRHHIQAGSIAGSINVHGYRNVRVARTLYLSHRLAWFYMTGAWPADQIDHVDMNGLNNAWSNLREATNSQNIANQGVRRNNRLGVKGVIQKHNRFQARICIDGKMCVIGSYDTKEDIGYAYKQAAEKHFGEFARAS